MSTINIEPTPNASSPLIPSPQRTSSESFRPPVPDLLRAAKIVVGDVPFTITSFDDAVQWLLRPTVRSGATSVRLSNAYCVAQARQDPVYADLLNSPGVNFPDGTPVHWLMQRTARETPFAPERVRGPSLFMECLAAKPSVPARHFFLGATPETLRRLRTEIELRHPHVQIAGMYAPPFAPVTSRLIDDWATRISTSGATIVWLGLGSPKQDFASALLVQKVNVHCVGVGAAFDFLAGTKREAPDWTQRLALEWAYRLVTEPRRLWRRYLVGNAQFFRAAIMRPGHRRRVIQPECQ
jgi:N-acetylglucosaminyldiphosphoundecaprenol N-acetyl-beta-D-mannosaminyltransferase